MHFKKKHICFRCSLSQLMFAIIYQQNQNLTNIWSIFPSFLCFNHNINDYLINKGRAFRLADLFSEIQTAVTEKNVPNYSNYLSEKLKKRIENYYGDNIVIQIQHGQSKSSVVRCSSINLSDAIKTAAHLKDDLNASHVELELGDIEESVEDEILHQAVGNLWREIAIPPLLFPHQLNILMQMRLILSPQKSLSCHYFKQHLGG